MNATTIHYPGFLNTLGDIVGTIRNLTNIEMNEKAARYKRGGRSDDVNNLGARGELIAQFVCFSKDLEYETTSLIAPSPLGEPDIITSKFRFDVKTIRTDAPDLLVNKDAHEKVLKKISHYWFIQQVDETTARYWVFAHSKVSGWPVKNVKYSDAYYRTL